MKEIQRLQAEDLNSADSCPAAPCRFFQIAGMTIRVTADLPINDQTFASLFSKFQVKTPGEDIISLHHHFTLPALDGKDLGHVSYHKSPWTIHRQDRSWIYNAPGLHRFAIFNEDHSHGSLYNDESEAFRQGDLDALTLLPSDQILLARVLPGRQAFLIHAAGMVLNGHGLLFVGHSEAGKSTTMTMLKNEGEILCDDRIAVRRWPDGFRIHGTWCHGDVPEVSPAGAPLRAVLLLQQSDTNRLEPIEDHRELARSLPLFVIRPFVTADWWEKVLAVLESVIREVPVYRLHFDKSGRVKEVLQQLVN